MESSRQLDPAPLTTESDDQADDGFAGPVVAADESNTHSTQRSLWGEPLRRLIPIALALFAVAMAVVWPLAHGVRGLSVFDEATHVDYAYQVAHGHIPAKGSVIAPVLRAEMLCRGPASRKVNLIRCGEVNPPAKTFPVGAQDYNFGHPPLYYAVTGVLARAAGLPLSGNHFILLARLVGVLWLFAGMLVLYLALRRFRVRWQLAVCGGLLVALTPAIFYLDSTVTPDAAAALCGGIALLTLARITVDGKLGWKLPTLLAFLAAGTKILNGLPFLAMAVVLVGLALHERGLDKARAKRLLFIAIGMVAAVGVVYVGWSLFQSHRGDPNWVNPVAGISTRKVVGLPFDELFGTSFSGVNLLSSGYLPPGFLDKWMTVLQRVLGPLSLVAVGAVLGLHRTWSPRFTAVVTAVAGIVMYPLVVEVQAYVSDHLYFAGVPSRYGLSFIPLLVAAIVLGADDKRLVKSMAGFTGAALIIALYTVY